MEIIGKIHSIGETKTFGESFNKRELVLYVENERDVKWSDYLKVELTQDRCSLLDSFNVGDELKASINLKGRLWTNPKGEEVCFNTIEAWRLEKLNTQPNPPQQLQNVITESEEQYDLPF